MSKTGSMPGNVEGLPRINVKESEGAVVTCSASRLAWQVAHSVLERTFPKLLGHNSMSCLTRSGLPTGNDVVKFSYKLLKENSQ